MPPQRSRTSRLAALIFLMPVGARAQGVAAAWGAYTGGVHLAPGQFAPLQLDASGNQLVSDGNSAAFTGVVPLTPGVPSTPLRSLGFIVTSPGSVTLTLADGSSLSIALQAAGGAFQTLPFAVSRITLGAGVAGSFWNLR